MFHKCTHIMCLTWNLQEHLECTQSVIGRQVAGTFNQSLQCTQDVFVGFQAPLPPVATKVEQYFAKLMSSLEVAVYPPEELREMGKVIEQEIELVDQDDNEQWRSDLPKKFSELSDKHFPLFITYDRVWTSVFARNLTS